MDASHARTGTVAGAFARRNATRQRWLPRPAVQGAGLPARLPGKRRGALSALALCGAATRPGSALRWARRRVERFVRLCRAVHDPAARRDLAAETALLLP